MRILAPLDLTNNRISNVGDPLTSSDAANKGYVDAVKQGLNQKEGVIAATTTNITLSGLQTIDTVAVADGQRVLVKDQTDQTENGIYVASSGSWVRSEDANTDAELSPGTFVFVEDGVANKFGGFLMMNTEPVTIGATDIRFTRFSAAGQITAGAGLTKNGQTLDVGGTPGRIAIYDDAIDIDSAYVGQTSITTLGAISTGTWNAATIAVAHGGTGATDAAGAKANLSFLTAPDLDELNAAVADYSTYASDLDATTSVYRKVEYKRYPAGTLYMDTTLSDMDANGDYGTLTINYYGTDGTTKIATHAWNLTYDSQHSVVTKVRTT